MPFMVLFLLPLPPSRITTNGHIACKTIFIMI